MDRVSVHTAFGAQITAYGAIMDKGDFDKFVQRQQVGATNAARLDPEQQLREWREYLGALYRQIEIYMASYVAAGTATLTFEDIELNEEFSGPYRVEQMLLEIGRSTVTFSPVGTMLIGSKGRVDVQGPRGTARLGLLNKNVTRASQLIRVTVSEVGTPVPARASSGEVKIDWEWKIISPAPNIQFITLTEDTFFEMILLIADAAP